MTAEIAIFNNQGIALAADSAVTIGRDRVWKHANKIFSAGPSNDIGLMIFNTGDFIGIPWEVVIKEYRRRVGSLRYDTVAAYADDFVTFLKSSVLANEEQEEISFFLIVIDIIEDLQFLCQNKDDDHPSSAALDVIEEQIGKVSQIETLDSDLKAEPFFERFGEYIRKIANEEFSEELESPVIDRLKELVFQHIRRRSESEYSTGLIIAGYGRNQLFPCIDRFVIDGKWAGFTRVWRTVRTDLNDEDRNGAGIIPFAQKDMAFLFIEGIYPRYFSFLTTLIFGLLEERSKGLINEYINDDNQRTAIMHLT